MLARRLTTILPAMRVAEALDTTRMNRVAGRTGGRTAVVTTRPFHGGLRYSMPMSTGNGIYGEAIRERHHEKTMWCDRPTRRVPACVLRRRDGARRRAHTYAWRRG
jgi:hypothetical protein